ncbi:hypothetical protein HDU87_004658 [Geranomyces variabilis]|uniref:Uncharacterized protein n=1 Tax=Geranomyces variabilis TaxID=109894 RepID=A0AAD5TIH5_9FUNG|nr:hypothetical protein HDU87_004658 [Geranomyces variabilis]
MAQPQAARDRSQAAKLPQPIVMQSSLQNSHDAVVSLCGRNSFFDRSGSSSGFSHGGPRSPLSFNFGRLSRLGASSQPTTTSTSSSNGLRSVQEHPQTRNSGRTQDAAAVRNEINNADAFVDRLLRNDQPTPSSHAPNIDINAQGQLAGAQARQAGPPHGKIPKPIALPNISNTPDVRHGSPVQSGSERNIWDSSGDNSSLSQPADIARVPLVHEAYGHERGDQDLIPKSQSVLPPQAQPAGERNKSPQSFLGDRMLDVSFIGNAEVENQLAATMMDLAGHIQQQNSTRQRRLEELTEELEEARACVEKQGQVISQLRENSQMVIQAVVGHREKASFNQERIENLQGTCKLYEMSLKNLGALISKAEDSKKTLQANLAAVEKDKHALSTEVSQMRATLTETQNQAGRIEEALQKRVDASNERLQELKQELEKLSKDAKTLTVEKDCAIVAHRADISRLEGEHKCRYDAVLAENQRITEDLKTIRESLAEHREQSAQVIASKNIEILSLETRMKSAEAQTEATMLAKRQLDEDVVRLERELAGSEVKATGALERESDLTARLEKTEDALQNKERELDHAQAAAKQELEDMGRKLRDSLAEVEQLRAQLECDRTRMQFEIDTLKGLGTDMDNRHAENISALEQIRLSQSREIERLTETCERLQKIITETHERSKKNEEDYYRALEDAQAAFQAERQEAQMKLQQAEAANAELVRNLQAASQSLTQSEEEKVRIREKHDQQLSSSRHEHEANQKIMQDAVAKAQADLAQAIAKHTAAESVNQELAAMKPKQATLTKRIKELEKELNVVNAQAGSAKQEASSAQVELGQLQIRLQTAEAALSAQTEQHAANVASLKATETRLEAELAALQLSLRNAADGTAEAESKKEHEISLLKKQFDNSERRREAEMSNLTAKVATLRNEKELLALENKRLQEDRKEFQNQLASKVEQNERLLKEFAALRENMATMEKAANHRASSRSLRECAMQTDVALSPSKPAEPIRLPRGGPLSRGATWIIPADAPSARRARGPLAPDDSLQSTPLLPHGESGRFSQIESLGEDDTGKEFGGDDAELLQDLLTAAAAAEDEYSEMMIQDAAQGPARPLIISTPDDSAAQYGEMDRTPKSTRPTKNVPAARGKENKQSTHKRRPVESEDDDFAFEAEPPKRQKVLADPAPVELSPRRQQAPARELRRSTRGSRADAGKESSSAAKKVLAGAKIKAAAKPRPAAVPATPQSARRGAAKPPPLPTTPASAISKTRASSPVTTCAGKLRATKQSPAITTRGGGGGGGGGGSPPRKPLRSSKQVAAITSSGGNCGDGGSEHSETSMTTTTTIHTQRTQRIYSTEKTSGRAPPTRLARTNTATRRHLLANKPPAVKSPGSTLDDIFGWPAA